MNPKKDTPSRVCMNAKCGCVILRGPKESATTYISRKYCCTKCAATDPKARQSVLPERAIAALRDLVHVGGLSTRHLAKGFGVNHTAIWQAVTTYPVLRVDGSVDHRYYTWDHVR